jgi:dihydrolipoamide dehydrogenase
MNPSKVAGSYDLVVIGGGPAGYAAAIRAGQLGKKVACVEFERAGGTCLNWGCIPSKALLSSANAFALLKNAADYGLSCNEPQAHYSAIIDRSRKVADTMGGGIEFLFKKNKVEYIIGKGHIQTNGGVEIVSGPAKGQGLRTKNILIATGCRPKTIPGIEINGQNILTSREFLALKKQPSSVIILGAGAIGVEFAYFLQTLGTSVTLVEMMDRILPIEDADVSATVEASFKEKGMTILTSTRAKSVNVISENVEVVVAAKDSTERTLTAEKLIVAVGVQAYTDELFSAKLEPKMDRGFIVVDDQYRTNIPNIYAAGDIIGPPWLAHVATYEALQCVNGIFGIAKPKRVNVYPGCTYCEPQVASIGITEQTAKDQKLEYVVSKFPFKANGKAVATGHTIGFVKLITGKRYGEILGAHIVGSEATELIAEYSLAMNSELTATEIHHTIHAHPTLSEALAEASALADEKKTIHI